MVTYISLHPNFTFLASIFSSLLSHVSEYLISYIHILVNLKIRSTDNNISPTQLYLRYKQRETLLIFWGKNVLHSYTESQVSVWYLQGQIEICSSIPEIISELLNFICPNIQCYFFIIYSLSV